MTDQPQFDFEAARSAKQQAMAQVEENADEAWKRIMYGLVVMVARHRPRFTSDDVFEAYYATSQTAQTHEPRALGPLMTRAAKAGVCRLADCRPVNSRRASRHSAPLSVWDSLIFEEGHAA